MPLPSLPAITAAANTLMALGDVGKRLYDWWNEDDTIMPVEKPTVAAAPVKAPRKKHDCTKFTQHQYDFICKSHGEMLEYNKAQAAQSLPRMTLKQLANRLNWALGLNKSERAYARIWNQAVARETLAVGEPIELPSTEMPGLADA